MDCLDALVFQVRLVPSVNLVKTGSRERLDHPERKVSRALKDPWDHRDLQVTFKIKDAIGYRICLYKIMNI